MTTLENVGSCRNISENIGMIKKRKKGRQIDLSVWLKYMNQLHLTETSLPLFFDIQSGQNWPDFLWPKQPLLNFT